jgi:hypothetical protein
MDRRKLLGYVMRQETRRAIEANKKARKALRSVLENELGPRLQAIYLAEAATELGINLEALAEIRAIVDGNVDLPDDVIERLERIFESAN